MAHDVDEANPHMHDYEAHVRAVEEDLEYYRTKRFEPRVYYFSRRGTITLYDILKAKSAMESQAKFTKGSDGERAEDIETRIRALEDGLDDYVKGIGLVSSDAVKGAGMVIEDNRKERGDYDEFFRIKKKEHSGTLEERIERLEDDLKDYQMLLDAFTFDHRGLYPPLYTVMFDIKEVFGKSSGDKLWVDVHEEWLEGA